MIRKDIGIGVGAFIAGLCLITVLVYGGEEDSTEHDTLHRSLNAFQAESVGLTPKSSGDRRGVRTDTGHTSFVEPRPCASYPWFRRQSKEEWEAASFSIGLVGSRSSLHDLTCMWAASQPGLALDSLKIPRYVQIRSDTLALTTEDWAFVVEMSPSASSPEYWPNTMFFVAQEADSLRYRDVGNVNPDGEEPSDAEVRALRRLDVVDSTQQYVWLEFERRETNVTEGDTSRTVVWVGHIFSHDEKRGLRHLESVPIRRAKYVNGEFVGSRQLDVSVPEPGIMVVSQRSEQGEEVTKGLGWHRWLGRHVIDTTATDERELR